MNRAGLVITAAIILRISLMLFRSQDLQNDVDAYLSHARTLQSGNGYCVPDTDRPTAFRPPGLPVLIAAVHRLIGNESMSIAIINLALSLCLMLATLKLCQTLNFHRHATCFVLIGLAIDPLLLRYSLLPMTEVASAAALVSGIALLTAKKRGATDGFLSGLCLGIGALIRPTLLLSIASAALLLFVTGLKKKRFAAVVCFLVACCLLIVPWTVRNMVHWHRFLPATTHGGYTMLLANNQTFYREVVLAPENSVWEGSSLLQWQAKIKKTAQQDGVDLTNESAVDQWNQRRAVATIRQSPWLFAKSMTLRWKRFWGLVPEVASLPVIAKWTIGCWYAGIFFCASIGLVFVRAKSRFFSWTVLLNVASFMALHSVYWTNTRMRTPIMPLLIVLAGASVNRLLLSGKPQVARQS